MRTHLILASILGLALAACGSKSSTPAGGGGDTVPTDTTALTDMAFEAMDHDQRKAFMKEVVMPEMKTLFVEFDPKYESFNCATCHGEGAADGSFEMPNAGLPVLPGDEAGWGKLAQDEPAWLEFMASKVKPAMAKLLKVTEFDPATNTGEFGCHGCHTMAGAPPAP